MIKKILKPTQSHALKSLNRQLKYNYFNQPDNYDPKKDYYRIL